MAITTEKELGEALKNGQDTIEIEGDLSNKVFRIKSTGKVAWVVAIGAIGISVALIVSTGGLGAPASAALSLGAVSVLGVPAATAAVFIAVAAGGVGALNSLRKYTIVSNSGKRLVLARK